MSDDNGKYKIDCSLGDLDLTVRGPDEEWVEEKFEEQWEQRLDEADEMKEAMRRSDRSAQ